MGENANRTFIERLSQSRIYQDYERAFSEASGLPLSLRPLEIWQPVHHGKPHENPFCELMAKHSRTCAACLQVQEKLTSNPGQDAYFHARILKPAQYQAFVRLLAIFGQHLSMVSNQLVVQSRNAEPPVITRAKQFIVEHQGDDLSLGEVARAVNTSTFYFCKMFKKATGLHFTDYLSRVRVEKARNLLLNPNARVSEVAYQVGFQSLTHFNRVFKRVAGQSPTVYRSKVGARN